MHLVELILRHPLQALLFGYTFIAQAAVVALRRILLPHIDSYQSLRLQLQRAYLSSCSMTFPDLTHRLPVGPSPEHRARLVGTNFTGYIIPGTADLTSSAGNHVRSTRCVVVYAHGGGYARGEAKMYIRYMERWVRVAAAAGLDLAFLSVEYRKLRETHGSRVPADWKPALTDTEPHPAQRNAFLNAYQYILGQGVDSQQIIFMGDSAGGGLCALSGIECLQRGLPQPAGSILISPWLDATMQAHEGGNALVETDYVVSANRICPIYWAQWLDGTPGTHPDVNPLRRQPDELRGLNPQLVLVGAGEFALQEAKDFARLCERANVRTRLICEGGQLHIYAMGSAWVDPAVRRKTDACIIGWMQECLASSGKR